MDTPETILSLEGVTKVYGSGERAVTALYDVSLQAHAGEVVLVMGPSGSGKTTLLTIAGALLRPTRGTVRVCNTDITRMGENDLASIRREKVAFVYQSFNLLEALTALENVSLVITKRALNGVTPQERAREMLDTLGLGQRLNSLPKQLSDGEEGCLSGAGGAHHEDDLSSVGLQADVIESRHGSLAGAVDLGDPFQAEDGFRRVHGS